MLARCLCADSAVYVQDRNLVSLPMKASSQKSARMTLLTVLKRFEFDPRLLRSGVLAVNSTRPGGEIMVFVKGAPSAIRHLIPTEVLPQDYQEVWLLNPQTFLHSFPSSQLRLWSLRPTDCYRWKSLCVSDMFHSMRVNFVPVDI